MADVPLRVEIFSYERKDDLKKRNLKFVIYLTPLWYEFVVIDLDKKKEETRIVVEDIEHLQNLLESFNIPKEKIADIYPHLRGQEEPSPEHIPLDSLVDLFYDKYSYTMNFKVFQPGDKVKSRLYPKRLGEVEFVELTGMKRFPMVLVRWDDGELTWELPHTLEKV